MLAWLGLILSVLMLLGLRTSPRLNQVGFSVAAMSLGVGLLAGAFLPLNGPPFVQKVGLCGLLAYAYVASLRPKFRPPERSRVRWFLHPDGTFSGEFSVLKGNDREEARLLRIACQEFRQRMDSDPNLAGTRLSRRAFYLSECPYCSARILTNREPGSPVEACYGCGRAWVTKPSPDTPEATKFTEHLQLALGRGAMVTFFLQPSAPERWEPVDAVCRSLGMSRLDVEPVLIAMLFHQMSGGAWAHIDPGQPMGAYVLVVDGDDVQVEVKRAADALQALDPDLRSASYGPVGAAAAG